MFLAYREGTTKYHYLAYYTICGLENLGAIVLFIIYYPDNLIHFNTAVFLCVVSIVSFIAGIIFMVVYYKYFHPNITSRRELERFPKF